MTISGFAKAVLVPSGKKIAANLREQSFPAIR